jgi:hypothetical protein
MLKIRRDSTVSELDERLKEAKITNKKFRKQLLQKDSELQVSFPYRQSNGVASVNITLPDFFTSRRVASRNTVGYSFRCRKEQISQTYKFLT